jgi:acyl carrier protein
LTSAAALAFRLPHAAAFVPQSRGKAVPTIDRRKTLMTDSTATYDRIAAQIEPFNKKGVDLTDGTTFAGDLEWDSLTVMDFVAAIEDEFDIIITMNMQAEIETVGQLVAAVEKLTA